MKNKQVKFLKQLLETPSATGTEIAVAELVRERLAGTADEIQTDVMGSVHARLSGTGVAPSLMLSAHMDEIGLMVTYISDEGFLSVSSVGGVDAAILPGMRVDVHASNSFEPLRGVVGRKPIHLIEPDERKNVTPIDKLVIDLGMPAKRVKKLVMVGDVITFGVGFERFGKNIAPVVAPIWDESKKVIGIIDVLHKRAFEFGPGGGRVEIEVPENKKPVLDELYDALKESVAETSEEFMEKFFAGEDFTYAEMIHGLRQGVKDLSLFPVVCGSAIQGMGTRILMDTIVELLPQPQDARALMAENEDGESSEFVVAPGALPTAFVFKTISDQYGKYSYVKVLSGSIKPDMPMVNARTGETEKLGRLYIPKGKKYTEVKELTCGDIGAIAKMDKVKTGDTLCEPRKVVKIEPIPFDEPCYSVAIAPKTRGQEDKMAQGLNRLNEEDPSFRVVNNAETHQMVVSGAGDIQIDVLVNKLKSRFGVEVVLDTPRVPYREKIRKTVSKQGRHKKQTGGSGQFGDVWIRFEPNEESEEMVFAEEVFGGSVPKNFFPAVEKGLREACVHGPLAGYPVVNLKAVLYDGSYHPVDSSEIAFKTAANLAYKAAMPEASPVLLEPVCELKVTVPDQYMGDILGDLNKRRGRVMGMTPTGNGEQVIEAECPEAELMSYAIDLRSMTQSRGSFVMHFVRYEQCSADAQAKAVAAAKAMQEAE